jgi:catechol 2,3-dioxygenase-like lactoylglutathione lyase family enzyme
MIIGVNHVQVNVSTSELPAARDFYLNFMGLKEIPRPNTFKSPGIWMHAGHFEMHIGVEDNVNRSATRAHVAYEVSDLAHWRKKVTDAGYPIKEQPQIPGYDRFQFRDPFGNNIEIIAKIR